MNSGGHWPRPPAVISLCAGVFACGSSAHFADITLARQRAPLGPLSSVHRAGCPLSGHGGTALNLGAQMKPPSIQASYTCQFSRSQIPTSIYTRTAEKLKRRSCDTRGQVAKQQTPLRPNLEGSGPRARGVELIWECIDYTALSSVCMASHQLPQQIIIQQKKSAQVSTPTGAPGIRTAQGPAHGSVAKVSV